MRQKSLSVHKDYSDLWMVYLYETVSEYAKSI